MNPIVLLELAKSWDKAAEPPEVITEDELQADVARRTALLQCARELRQLVRLLGGVQ